MIDNQTSNVIAELVKLAAQSQLPSVALEAISLTGALPVRLDWGAILLLRSDGELVEYEPEPQTVSRVVDHLRRIAGMVAAARKYPARDPWTRVNRNRLSRGCDRPGRLVSLIAGSRPVGRINSGGVDFTCVAG